MPVVPIEAAADPTGANFFLAILENYGPVGLIAISVVYFGWKNLPRLIEAFKEDARKTREALQHELAESRKSAAEERVVYTEALEKQREAFVEAIADQRKDFIGVIEKRNPEVVVTRTPRMERSLD